MQTEVENVKIRRMIPDDIDGVIKIEEMLNQQKKMLLKEPKKS